MLLFYTGKLVNYEFINNIGLVLTLHCAVRSEYYNGNVKIRIYVPKRLEEEMSSRRYNWLELGTSYAIQALPYKKNSGGYKHRIDVATEIYRA